MFICKELNEFCRDSRIMPLNGTYARGKRKPSDRITPPVISRARAKRCSAEAPHTVWKRQMSEADATLRRAPFGKPQTK